MATINKRHKFFAITPLGAAWILASSLLCFLLAAYFGWQWQRIAALNRAYADRSLARSNPSPDAHLQQYAVGYLVARDMKNAHRVQQATRAFTLAETSSDPALRARAKFALGNMYYDLALASAEIAKGGSHQQAVAQIELAREAYKGALRLDPLMYDARFNLELLDRKSPEKRTQAWLQETDGVTLQPFKRNGTAMMKDNTRRGLP